MCQNLMDLLEIVLEFVMGGPKTVKKIMECDGI